MIKVKHFIPRKFFVTINANLFKDNWYLISLCSLGLGGHLSGCISRFLAAWRSNFLPKMGILSKFSRHFYQDHLKNLFKDFLLKNFPKFSKTFSKYFCGTFGAARTSFSPIFAPPPPVDGPLPHPGGVPPPK